MENASSFLVAAACCYPAAVFTYCSSKACCRPGAYISIHKLAELRLAQGHGLLGAGSCGGPENEVTDLLQCMNDAACSGAAL